MHRGTNRLAVLVCVDDIWSHPPVSLGSAKYVLVFASEREAQLSKVGAARAWIEAGASYICAWGPCSPEIEETFDYAGFLPELGDPVPFTLMTTSHPDEPLEEALWFAFYNGKTPEELEEGASPVVIVVDSEALEARSRAWVEGNVE